MPVPFRGFDPAVLKELDEVDKAIVEDDQNKVDLGCRMGELEFVAKDTFGGTQQTLSFTREDGSGRVADARDLSLTQSSFSQLCRKLGTPAQYLDRCPAFLVNSNNNHWIVQKREDEVLLRYRDLGPRGLRLRGIVPGSYDRFDNKDFWEILKPVLQANAAKIQSLRIDDGNFDARILFPDTFNVGTETRPDGFNLGVHVGNSELGDRPCSVDMISFRLVCSNGAVAMVNDASILHVSHGKVDRRAFPQLVQSSLEKLRGHRDTLLGSLERARDIVYDNPVEVMNRAFADFSVDRTLAKAVITEFVEGVKGGWYDRSKFSVFNAMTRYAQELSTPVRRLRLETTAGKFLASDHYDASSLVQVPVPAEVE